MNGLAAFSSLVHTPAWSPGKEPQGVLPTFLVLADAVLTAAYYQSGVLVISTQQRLIPPITCVPEVPVLNLFLIKYLAVPAMSNVDDL